MRIKIIKTEKTIKGRQLLNMKLANFNIIVTVAIKTIKANTLIVKKESLKGNLMMSEKAPSD